MKTMNCLQTPPMQSGIKFYKICHGNNIAPLVLITTMLCTTSINQVLIDKNSLKEDKQTATQRLLFDRATMDNTASVLLDEKFITEIDPIVSPSMIATGKTAGSDQW
jgi:hypothetical protein